MSTALADFSSRHSSATRAPTLAEAMVPSSTKPQPSAEGKYRTPKATPE